MFAKYILPSVLVGTCVFAVSVARASDGEALYQRLCTSCHGYQGEGRAGLGPALVDSTVVKGELSGLIDVVARGREDTLMVAFERNLSPETLAAIITYVRQRFAGDENATVNIDDL